MPMIATHEEQEPTHSMILKIVSDRDRKQTGRFLKVVHCDKKHIGRNCQYAGYWASITTSPHTHRLNASGNNRAQLIEYLFLYLPNKCKCKQMQPS